MYTEIVKQERGFAPVLLLLIVGIVLVGGFVFWRMNQEPGSTEDKYQATTDGGNKRVSNIKPDYSESRTISEDGGLVTVDFSQCTQDRRRIDVTFGSTTIAVEGKRGSVCRIYYGGEVENPDWDGSLPGTCDVPTSLGKVSFSKTSYSVDLSAIQEYCSD